jgi:hypothetical protein
MTRVFPAVAADMYSVTPSDPGVAVVWELAQREPPAMTLLLRRTPADTLAIQRLLNLHRRGLDAELEGKSAAAELLFSECVRFAKRLSANSGSLSNTLEKVSPGVDADRFARALLTEVLGGVSLAAAAGADEADARVARHLGYAAEFLQLEPTRTGEAQGLIEAVQRRRIEVLRKTGNLAEAANAARQAADLEPSSDYWAKQSAVLLLDSLLSGFSPGNDINVARRNVAAAERVLPDIWAQSRKHPRNIYLYDVLSTAQEFYAVALANSDRLADAVKASHFAVLCNPVSQNARAISEAVARRVDDTRAQLDEVRRQIRDRPNTRMSPEGERLSSEADRAARMYGALENDEGAKRIQRDRPVALARHVWRNALGAEVALTPEADAAASAFCALIEATPRALSPDALVDHVRAALAAQPALAGVSAEAAAAYVRRLDGEVVDASTREADTTPPAYEGPRLSLPASTSGGGEPLLDWWAAPRDGKTKLAAAAAAVFFLIGGGLFAYDATATTMRNGAYENLLSAAEAGDMDAVAQHARAFASWTPLGADARQYQVAGLAAVAQDHEARNARDEARAALDVSLESGDLTGALDAAENFLTNVTPGVDDPRQGEVRDLYYRAFNAWLLTDDAQGENADMRTETFRRLSTI